MDRSAFFFQGTNVLLSANMPNSSLGTGVPLHFTAAFAKPEIDVFEIPPVTGEENIVCVSVALESPLPPRWRALPVRQSLAMLTSGMVAETGPFGRLFRAFHIAQWRYESRYCGTCGTKNADSPDLPARLCPACGRQEFPRISPAVITIITNDENKALLAHNKKFLPGVYSLIAGFTEAGESLEATVIREIQEEVGLEVTDLRYIASQPWPFPNSLMLGFAARYASGTIHVDGVEIEDAQWFSKDNLPKLPGNGSVSRYLINKWIGGMLTCFP